MICKRGVLTILAAVIVTCSPCLAGDWSDYGDFRYTLGLPGNGYGVTSDGSVGFGGAFHIGIPCAYTPAAGNYSGSYYVSSTDNTIRFGDRGQDVNGTGHVGVGFGKAGNGVYLSQTFVEERLSVNCWNAQWQALAEDGGRPALAIGVLDALNERIGERNVAHGGRSVYAVASKELIVGEHPLFASLGLGTDRFSGVFAGLSWYPYRKLNLGMEYDGLILRPHLACEMYSTNGWTLIGALAWSDFDRPMLGLAVTFGQ